MAEDRNDRLGELLYLTSLFYFANSEFFMNQLAKDTDILTLRHPSMGMAGMKFNANFLFGIPSTIASVNLAMDVDRDIISPASKTYTRRGQEGVRLG